MSATVIALISSILKLAVEAIDVAHQLEQEGFVVPGLDEVKSRLETLKNSKPLPTKGSE